MTGPKWWTNRASARSHGQSLVELALMLPVLSLILLGALDLGRVFFYHARLINAVKEGAFYGAYSPYNTVTNSTDDIRARAYAEAGGRLGQADVDFVVDPTTGVRCYEEATTTALPCQDAGKGDTVEVTGRYTFRPMTTQIVRLWGSEFQLQKTVRMTIVSGYTQ